MWQLRRWYVLAGLLTAGCSGSKEPTPPGQGDPPSETATPPGSTGSVPTGSTTTTEPGDTGTTDTAGTSTTIVQPPTCYTLEEVGYQTSVSRIPAAGGLPVSTQLFTGGLAAHMVTSLTWFDGAWWACDGFQLWVLDPLLGNSAAVMLCEQMYELGGELVVQPYSFAEARHYVSYNDLIADAPVALTPGDWMGGTSRMGSDAALVYGAWHSTDRLQVYDPVADTESDLILVGFNTWVWGIDDFNGEILVLDDGRQVAAAPDPMLRGYDPITGAELSRISLGASSPNGLWCGVP